MPNATELAIDTSADALTLATAIFGNGVTVGTATLTGNVAASATYSGADATLGDIAPGDSGIILSTGNAADFTNSSGTTDTNTSESGASTNHNGAGDTALGTATGQTTFDAVVLEATFTPVGDYITMLFTFSSEEYLEYVNGGVNDAFGVWVNTAYVPFNPVASGVASIDTINDVTSSNLYRDNDPTADTYNTEMDGTTLTLSINAPVNAGDLNTIRIALADGGDGVYDSNVLIAANSVQTVAVAFDDDATIEANTATTIDVLDNDIDTTGLGLTITEINGVPVIVGQTVTLPTGEQVTLNADGTLTVLADGDLGSEPFSYTVVDSAGNTDVAFITLTTEADIPLNYIVEGTSGDELIDSTYALDPQGDVIDGNDAADGSNNDSVQAGAGNDTVASGLGDDTIDAGLGNDRVFAGGGNDSVIAGDGNDTVFGEAGNDTLLGGEGADSLDGDAGNDSLDGGSGNDTLIGDTGLDTLIGGAGNDEIYGSSDANLIDGGADNDLVFGGNQNDTISGGTEMDSLYGNAGDDIIDGGADADFINGGDGNDRLLGGTGNDTVSGGQNDDSIDGGDGADVLNGDDGNDTVIGGAGNDSVFGGTGDDSLSGGIGNDSMEAWIGNDTLDGGEGDDYLDGADGNDSLVGGDGNDTLLGGNNGGQDTLIGGAGNDSMSAGDGDDTLLGGIGDDTQQGAGGDDLFVLENDFGNDQIEGGETTEATGDTLDLSAVTDDLTVDLTSSNPEAGTVSDGTDTATFVEIENIVLGAGVDTLVLADASGDDVVGGFTAPTVDGFGNWTGVDVLDVTAVTDANGAPVNTDDVTVSDTNGDGTGDAILIFPGGESLTLTGVPASTFIDPEALEAIGIPLPNYIVEGGAGDDLINGAYTGDPEGDMVDASDNATGTNDDSIVAGAGNDTVFGLLGDDTILGEDGNDVLYGGGGADSILGGSDNDSLYGGNDADTLFGGTGDDLISGDAGNDLLDGEIGNDTIAGGTGSDTIDGAEGDDVIVLEDGFGNDSIDGGQTTETTGDTLDLSATTTGVTVDLTDADPEDGTVSNGTDTANFVDIENILLGGGRDTVVLADGSGADAVQAFDLTDSGDGTTNDQLDVSGLTSDGGTTPVNTNDVVVTETNGDGTGDAILTFTGGESITLVGVLSSEVDSVAELVSIGIPIGPNYIVEGGAGDDFINGAYTGDPEGDMVDANDNATGTNDDSIVAGAGNDTVVAGAGADTISGGDGNDNLSGNDGDDVILGEADDDLLYGGDGNDTLNGGSGNDILQGGIGADSLIGGTGNDNIGGGDGNDTIEGGGDNDNITGGTGDDSLAGGTGDDSIWGGIGDDTITGGSGNDALYANEGNDEAFGGAGDDYIQLTSGNDTVNAGNDADNIDVIAGGYVDGAVISVQGGTGGVDTDTLDLGDWTYYRNLTETVDGDADSTSGSVEVQDAAGNWVTVNFDEIENLILPPPAPNYIVEGTAGADSIGAGYTGDPEGDMVDNNDMIDGSNDDSIEAGAGNDTVDAGAGDDTVMGGDGDDNIRAGDGDDLVFGEAGNDVMFGFDGNDTLQGGDGNDVFNGMSGNDSLDGGNDNDTFVVEDGFGADTIVGGEGVTTGTDFDTINLNAASIVDPVTVLFSTDETGTLSDGTDTLAFSEIERIRLAGGDDTIDGSATAVNINVDSGAGNDSIIGGAGDDNIAAGDGNDTIQGGMGADEISAGDGDDVIDVAQGDTVNGSDGDDTFTLVDLAEPGTDAIFVNGGEGGETNGDTLDLNGIADRTTINITNPIDVAGGISGTVQLLDGTVVNFANIENIICFVPGTMIATHAGLRKIEDLKVGDPVMTQDNGIQKIGWIGKTTVSAQKNFAPVHFAKSVFPGATDDLIVSPQHRMLVKGYRAELLFGQSEVLMPAIHMIDGKDVTRLYQEDVTYIHIMFEQHEIIFANGIPTESFHPGAFGVDTLADQAREELFTLFPELRSDLNQYGSTARMALKAREAKVLAGFV